MNKGILVTLLVLCFSSVSVLAKGLSVEQSQRYLHDSGLGQILDSMPEMMAQQINLERLSAKNQEDIEKASQAIQQAIAEINGQSLAIDYLTTHGDAEKINEAFAFLETEVGKRILAAEAQANTPSAAMEMQKYAMEMASNPPNDSRISVVQGLVDQIRTDRWMYKIMESAFFASVDLMETLDKQLAVELRSAMENEWQTIKPMLEAQMEQGILMGAYYSYRNLSDDDIRAYSAFLETPAGQSYAETGMEIINQYMQAFLREMMMSIQRET